MKACTGCGVEYPLEHFSKKGSGRSTRCKSCVAEYYRNYYHGSEERKSYVRKATKAHAEKHKIRDRAKKYGLSEEQLQEMINRYNGKCWICLEEDWYSVDHDHSCCPTVRNLETAACGKCVRGLLCQGCNKAIGMLKDDPRIVKRMEQYLVAVYPHSDKVLKG